MKMTWLGIFLVWFFGALLGVGVGMTISLRTYAEPYLRCATERLEWKLERSECYTARMQNLSRGIDGLDLDLEMMDAQIKLLKECK